MNRNHSLVILFVLVIAPMFPVFMVQTTNAEAATSLIDIPEEVMDVGVPDTLPNDDVDLSMMFFTETPSSEDGLYYVCRRGTDAIAYFGASTVMYLAGDTVFTLEFPDSNEVIPHGENPTGSVTNYLLGNDQSNWKTGVEDCSLIRYTNIYPGIDLVYKLDDGNLKYEFVVAPNANPGLIQMRYPDASMLDVQGDSLTVSKSESSFSDAELFTFQGDVEVTCAFQSIDGNTIKFDIGEYEESQELIIDPFLVYSTFLGGSYKDGGRDIAVENNFIYVTGITISANFPTINAFNSTYSGDWEDDCFVTKFAPDGQTLIYSTFLGGALSDYADGIAVESGFAYIAGHTYSTDFPTFNAYDSTPNGNLDCFVT
ncbi:MAG: DUF7948 domain-containing protein, partial [Candidatus Thorarchaeota archaeon]